MVSGGFPCQDISAAGKGAGIEGAKSGMWKEMARIIGEVRPRYAFVENSPMLTTRGLGVVLADLASMGFDAEYGVLSAADVGANHLRERIWILAYSKGIRYRERGKQRNIFSSHGRSNRKYSESKISESGNCSCEDNIPNPNSTQCKRRLIPFRTYQEYTKFGNACWWRIEPELDRMANGVADRVDRLKAIGNGQVPLCAATAFELLRDRIENADS